MEHRFIIVGHGMISKAYVKALSTVENVGIVGVVGRDEERAGEFARQHGIGIYGTSIADVAARSRATAAVICTPNALHADGVLEASGLGLHCICEKPLHIDPDTQQEMLNSCEVHNVKLGVSYMRRFLPHIRYLKDILSQGMLGRVQVVDVMIKHFRPKAYYDSWHGTIQMDGGGPFIQQGSHIIDMALWLCGGYEEILDARRFKVYHEEIETEDHGYALVRYANNAVGMIEASTGCKGISKDVIEITGSQGSIVADYEGIQLFEVEGVAKPDFTGADTTNEWLFEQLIRDFVRAVESDGDPFVTGRSSALATQFITEIYQRAGEPRNMVEGQV